MTSQMNSLTLAIRNSHGELVTDFASRELIDGSRLAVAVLDAEGRVVAASDAAPVANVEALVRTSRENDGWLVAGDAAITNDPYSGGRRVQDHFVLVPIFGAGDALVGTAVVCAPFVDVGGLRLGNDVPDATDLWAEGVRTTLVRVRRGGEPDADVLRQLKLNSRVPVLIEADTTVMCDVAERLAAEVAPALADGTAEKLLAQEGEALAAAVAAAEGRTAEAVRAVPGAGDGDELKVKVAVSASGGRLAVDLAGSSPQVDGSHVNAVSHNTVNAVAEAVRDATGSAPSSAITGLLDVSCPDHSVVSCDFPRPVGGSVDTTCKAVYDATSECLEQVLASSAAN